jgi:hypothetical protein
VRPRRSGTQLGRPRVDTLKGSRHANMMQIRGASLPTSY